MHPILIKYININIGILLERGKCSKTGLSCKLHTDTVAYVT